MHSDMHHTVSAPTFDYRTDRFEQDSFLLNALPTGVVICDQSGVIHQANNVLLTQFGYASHELIGQTLDMLLPVENRAHHQEHLTRFFTHPQKRIMGLGRELHARRKDGTVFPVEIGLNPLKSSNAPYVLATIADITERRQIEFNFRAVVDAAPVGMLIIGDDGMIRHANPQLLSIFGYGLPEIVDRPIETLIPERYRHAHPQQRNAYLIHPSTRSMGINRDLTGLHKSGVEVPIEIGLNPINLGGHRAIVATVSDITERKRNELQLRQLNADLDEFTYIASHDLRAPLRGISNLIDWIDEDLGELKSPNVQHNLDRVRLRIARMDKLVEDLLAYAKSCKQTTDVTRVDLRELIDEVIQFIDPPSAFEVTVSGDSGVIVTSPTPLETVLRNLLSNAIKHHDRDRGRIAITIRFDNSFCVFEVSDDGPGIPPSAHERIFKLFQTLSNAEESRSGVGLAVSKRLVENHGGCIEVHSEANTRGSCFRFWWPRFARSDVHERVTS